MVIIEAQKRKLGNRSASRKAFRNGQVTCVYYTRKENIPLLIDRRDFEKKLSHIYSNTVINLNIEGEEKKVLIQAHDIFLFNRRISHVDFLGIGEGNPFKVKIPLDIRGISVGVTKGGVLRRFVNYVRALCKDTNIPVSIPIDITNMDVGDIVYMRDLAKAHQDISFLEPMQKPIISILVSRALQAEEESKESVVDKKESPKKE